jgi:glycine C-acetyltransferase
MFDNFKNSISEELKQIKANGLYKSEKTIITPQSSKIKVEDGKEMLNFCSNNYLGLSDDTRLIAAAKESYDLWGYGLSSVRFICGTQKLHKDLESKLSSFLGTEDTILYSSCFDANGGLFETLLSTEDAIISDELNHASIIDGVRLCKAQKYRYKNCDMSDLEAKLKEAKGARRRLIATDGVFSMDGIIAPLADICELADKYDAVVMVDDSHAVGFIGKKGRGTHELHNVIDRVDILTGTFGKALGGASGGYTSGRKEIIELLRQRSRPYLFSNTLAPAIAYTTLKVLDILTTSTELRDKLEENTLYFREKLRSYGFNVNNYNHPIVPIILGDEVKTIDTAQKLFEMGIYVVGFSYPVVPKGKARIRIQISAGHSKEQIDYLIAKLILSLSKINI